MNIFFFSFLVKTYHNISIENELRENLFRKYDKVVIPNSRDGIFVVNMRMVLKSAELVSIKCIRQTIDYKIYYNLNSIINSQTK